MSFGYSVGDFIAAVTIIQRVCEKIKNAPQEYRSLSKEVESLGIAIQEVINHAALSSGPTTNPSAGNSRTGPAATPGNNTSRIQELGKSCHDVLDRLERELAKYPDLGSPTDGSAPSPGSASGGSKWFKFKRSVGRCAKRVSQGFSFDPEEIRKVREELRTHLQSFNTVQLNNASSTINSVSQGVEQMQVKQTQVGKKMDSFDDNLSKMSLQQQDDTQKITSINQGVNNLDVVQTQISNSITSIGHEVHQLNASHDMMSVQQRSDSQNIISISNSVGQLNQTALTQQRNTILDWISPVDFTSTHEDIIQRRQPGTGECFLKSGEYQTWLRSPGETLLCEGMPGAGKTMLTAIAIEHLDDKFSNTTTENVAIACVYFSYQKQETQGVLGVLASLLRQLYAYRQPLPTEIQSLYAQRTNSKRKALSLEELMKHLDMVVRAFSRVFILLDALDECRQGSTLLSILSEIFALQKRSQIVNLLATSRSIPQIVAKFNNPEEGRKTPVIEVGAKEADVRMYLEGQSDDLPPFAQRDKELQGQIVNKIVDSVDGMFLLAQLHFLSIKEHTDKASMQKALSRLKSGSDAYEIAYEEAMDRIKRRPNAGVAKLGMKVLTWITCARRPLRTNELQHALAVEEGRDSVDKDKITEIDDLVSCCAGLVTVEKQSGIIRLVHYTAQEYFQRARDKWFPTAEAEVVAVCLRYLTFPALTAEVSQSIASEYPLYNYAILNWGHHLRRGWLPCKDLFIGTFPTLRKSLEAATYDVPNMRGYNLGRGYDPSRLRVKDHTLDGLTALHLLVYFNLHEALEFFLDEMENPDKAITEDGQTLLGWAAAHGHQDVIRVLISKGANIEKFDWIHQTTPLMVASFHGHAKVVRLLLDMGAKLTARGADSILVAVRKGHTEVVRAILERDREKSQSCYHFTKNTVLMEAAAGLHLEIVQLLLQHLPDDAHEKKEQVNKINKGFESALSKAVFSWSRVPGRRMQVIRSLLDAGAHPDRCRSDFRTLRPCIVGALNDPEILRLLLSRGAGTEYKSKWTWTPLIFEVVNIKERICEMKDMPGWTHVPESWFKSFDILLEYGADINGHDKGLRTPLMHAIVGGHLDAEEKLLQLVKRIVAGGAYLDRQDDIGKTALQHAIERGYQTVVDFLVASGARVGEGVDLDVKRFTAKKPFHDPIVVMYFQMGYKLRGG